jgi:hypothetical protein
MSYRLIGMILGTPVDDLAPVENGVNDNSSLLMNKMTPVVMAAPPVTSPRQDSARARADADKAKVKKSRACSIM